ncbi:MAG TPA: type II secretion system protein GspM [Acidimicrobiales bacterium]|nr:type II secretion system protein GspM [Acidimicrobiales bacterium]
MRKRAVLTALGALVMVVVFWFAAWSPATRQLSRAHDHLAKAESQQVQLRDQLTTLRAEYKQLPQYEADLQALEAAVPADPSVASIFDQLTSAAAASGVSLPSVSPSQPATGTPSASTSAAKGGPADVEVSMAVDGQYGQILNFITRLDSSPRLFVVDDVTLAAGAKGGAMAASLQVQAFYADGGASQ